MVSKRDLERRLKIVEDKVDSLCSQLEHSIVDAVVPDVDPIYHAHTAIEEWGFTIPTKKVKKLTINGKVELILQHLGIRVEVEQKKCLPAKAKIIKVKKTKGKK